VNKKGISLLVVVAIIVISVVRIFEAKTETTPIFDFNLLNWFCRTLILDLFVVIIFGIKK